MLSRFWEAHKTWTLGFRVPWPKKGGTVYDYENRLEFHEQRLAVAAAVVVMVAAAVEVRRRNNCCHKITTGPDETPPCELLNAQKYTYNQKTEQPLVDTFNLQARESRSQIQ